MSNRQHLLDTLSSWPGVTTAPHRYGGVEFQVAGREIGHLHGDQLVDIPFPKPVRDQVIADGLALPHHILPESGWISRPLRQPEDLQHAVVLLRMNYDLLRARQAPHEAAPRPAGVKRAVLPSSPAAS